MGRIKLYETSGYVNIKGILETGYPFIFIWGGRGTGKTYGILKYLVEEQRRFVLMRSLQKQSDMMSIPQFNPFKQYNADTYSNINPCKLGRDFSAFYNCEIDEEGRNQPVGDILGYTASLSTIGNLRGFGASDVEVIFYDEFIPEKSETPVRNACYSLLNGYETINRNRELQNKPPVQLVCASNSENVASDIFIKLGLVRKASEMAEKGQEICFLTDRGILLINLCMSEISQRKADTALYRMVGRESDFYKMAVSNSFYNLDYSDVQVKPLNEYRPMVTVGEITIYEHKSKMEYYVTKHPSGTPVDTFGLGEKDLSAFIRKYVWIWTEYLDFHVIFSDIESKILFDNYLHS